MTALLCKDIAKIPFNKHYAAGIKNEERLPDFLRIYLTNDYESDEY